jgi:gliding motility-associated-like protein
MVLLSDSLIAGVECRIFDRWGDIVFESKELPIVWDGVFNNKNVLPGVYVYLLKLKSINGEIRFLSGDFTLIR